MCAVVSRQLNCFFFVHIIANNTVTIIEPIFVVGLFVSFKLQIRYCQYDKSNYQLQFFKYVMIRIHLFVFAVIFNYTGMSFRIVTFISNEVDSLKRAQFPVIS